MYSREVQLLTCIVIVVTLQVTACCRGQFSRHFAALMSGDTRPCWCCVRVTGVRTWLISSGKTGSRSRRSSCYGNSCRSTSRPVARIYCRYSILQSLAFFPLSLPGTVHLYGMSVLIITCTNCVQFVISVYLQPSVNAMSSHMRWAPLGITALGKNNSGSLPACRAVWKNFLLILFQT